VIGHLKVFLWVCRAARKDFGFVANRGWEEGLGRQVTQLIWYLVVTQDYETAFLASQGMSYTSQCDWRSAGDLA
jgi:hypothetical protein